MNPAKRRAIFEQLRSDNPHPRTELDYATPFQLLVAVVLSAQATDRSVNLATRDLFPRAGTPEAIVALGESELASQIRTIGLYRTKARHVLRLSQLLLERHGGAVPASRAELEALPGVGRKTANVILNTAFGQPTIAVDTHIFRVANRTGLAPGATVETPKLLAWCRERLASFKCPKSVDIVAELPRNATGKVLKKDLRKPYWEGRTRQVV